MSAREKRRRAKYAALPNRPESARASSATRPKQAKEDAREVAVLFWSWEFAAAAAMVLATFLWMFSGTMWDLVQVWEQEQDYSHGFIVVPIALLLLWMRKDTLPAASRVPGWLGLGVIAISLVVAAVGQRFFLAPLAGWAMVVWVAGACWLLAGRRIFFWAAPAIAFLLFMVPLPFRIEQLMSWRLQRISTMGSTWMLQLIGQPAIAEGNIVYLKEHVLEVEQACSGLRMFMGVTAMAFAFAVATRRPWWEKLLILASVAPLAMLANSVRVATNGILLQSALFEGVPPASIDTAAGYVMIVFATICLGLFLLWLRWVVQEVEADTGRTLISQTRTATTLPV